MRSVRIVDGQTVIVRREDVLIEQLRQSIALGPQLREAQVFKQKCEHPMSERHVRCTQAPDTGGWYEIHSCDVCATDWDEYPDTNVEEIP